MLRLHRTVASHLQSMVSPKDIAAILRHPTPGTAAINYVQQQDESVRETAEKLAALLGYPRFTFAQRARRACCDSPGAGAAGHPPERAN